MGLRAGLLRESVSIQTATVSRNDYGEEITTWATTSTTRARVDFRNGSRLVDVNEVFGAGTVKFIVRKNINVTVYDRLQWRGQLYSIQSVDYEVTRQSKVITAQVINE